MAKSLKIWVVEIGEPLPLEEGVRLHRCGKLTSFLASKGHQVTWWTSGFSHSPKKHIVSETKTIPFAPNLELKVIKGLGYKSNVTPQRFRHQKDFADQFYELAQPETKPDVIIASVPTLEGASRAARYAREHKVPLIVDMRDYWPRDFVELMPSFLRFLGPLVFRTWFKQIREACTQAAAIVGISLDIRDYGLKYSGREATALDRRIPHGYRRETLSPQELQKGRDWLKTLPINDDDFVICYFGTIGRFFDLTTVINAAKELTDKPIKFVLAGSGDSLERYKAEAKDVPNVIFPGWIKDAQIQAIMERSSLGLAPYKKGAHMSMPNKPFEYMAGGLPVLYSFHGELAELFQQTNSGHYYTADSVSELKEQVLWFFDHNEERKQMAQNAKKLFEDNFSLDIVFPKYEELIQGVVEARMS